MAEASATESYGSVATNYDAADVRYHVKVAVETREGCAGSYTVKETVTTNRLAKHKETPIYVLPQRSKALAETTRGVARMIYQTKDAPVDNGPSREITCSTAGAMRSWHQNDYGFLPVIAFDPTQLRGKPLLYHNYIVANRRLQNKQVKKEIETKSNDKWKKAEEATAYSGYVEFTACSMSENQWGRLAYDYVNDKIYYNPSHYLPFKVTLDETGMFPKVREVVVTKDCSEFDPLDGWYNPWFYVAEY